MKRPADDDEDSASARLHSAKQPLSPVAVKAVRSSSPFRILNGDVASPHHCDSASSPTCQNSDLTLSAIQPTGPNMDDKVVILDCGAQYGKVIDRRVRELFVESEIMPLNTPLETILERKYKAIIISGGPKSVYSNDSAAYDLRIFKSKIPILGICYGFQLINKEFGGSVERNCGRVDGQQEVKLDLNCSLFKGLHEREQVLLTHGDVVKVVAPGFTPVSFANGYIAGIGSEQQKIFGVQFHPEVDLTLHGQDMLRNFVFNVAGCRATFTMSAREQFCIDEIRRIVKDKKVLLLCSGGVDSTVCAALLKRALGRDRLYAIHIDNGFMRKNESAEVQKSLESLDVDFRVYSKGHTFYNGTTYIRDRRTGEMFETAPLMSVTAPEVKRRIIGDTFIKVTEEVLVELKLNYDEVYLAQGTLRPDLIESASHLASGGADAIKTHHNDTELVRALRAKGRVVEPLKDFHKDEVRKLGLDLGLPERLVMRHPFPGPGLAIRILCRTEPYICRDFNETHNTLRVLARFNDIGIGNNAMENAILHRLSQLLRSDEKEQLRRWAATYNIRYTLLPVQSVGVQGDCRTYSYVVAISTDARPTPWSVLMQLSRLIPRILDNINRIVYVFGPSVNETALTDVTPTLLTSTAIKLAQEADFVATRVLTQAGHMRTLSQMPVVVVPVHFDRPFPPSPDSPSVRWSVAIRTFITNDFMTGVPAEPGLHIPEKVVADMANAIKLEVPLISRVMYDLTAKPPGTTEWE